jgi:hypothetical protein
MITIEQVLYVIPLLTLSASITYYAMVIRNQNKTQQQELETRQTHLFMQFYGTATPEMIKRGSELLRWEWDDYEDFEGKYWNGLDARSEWISFLGRFDGLGLLAMRHQVDLDLIYKFDPPIIPIWDKFEDVINQQRVIRQLPDLYEGFEFLYDEMLKSQQAANTFE